MIQEHLFASFILDHELGLEIALRAEHVTEATAVNGTIQKLPGSIPFIEGVMHLRDDVIPVINLKKRLGLDNVEYTKDAKVAVITLLEHRFGLLFEDIKEVFKADQNSINPVSKLLQTEDQIISALIKIEPGQRAVELLDLNHLFSGDLKETSAVALGNSNSQQAQPTSYSRYVAFECAGQEYGVTVNLAREITFYSKIDEMFKAGMAAGTLKLRGKTIPIINTHALLTDNIDATCEINEKTRVLILASDNCIVGLIVDEIKEILSIPDHKVLPFPAGNNNVIGMFSRSERDNIILLNMNNLVCDHIESIKSMARLSNHDTVVADTQKKSPISTASHHLITENCYLIFTINKHFAIEIKDVKEIIENSAMIKVPKSTGYTRGVINLRGEVVPVVDLRNFYNYPPRKKDVATKLIICKAHDQTVALEVDNIVTIFKQEQYHATPSLGNQLRDKKDTVDRLIEYLNPEGLKEHVLVVNTHSLIRNHLQVDSVQKPEKDHCTTEKHSNNKKS